MPQLDPDYWSKRLRQTLELYDESLLRQVAAKFIKPRSQWPANVLIDRLEEATTNAALIDRRLKELPTSCRQLLKLIGLSRQPRWFLGNLIEMTIALGEEDGLGVVTTLLQSGFLFPDLSSLASPFEGEEDSASSESSLKSFDAWLSQATTPHLHVFAHPQVTGRPQQESLDFPDWSSENEDETIAFSPSTHTEADGLEWFLRMTILWQQVKFAPLRLTLQGDFFKRDLDRLTADSLLATSPAELLETIPDIGLLTVSLAVSEGILNKQEGELHATTLPDFWEEGLPASVASLWAALPELRFWTPTHGWRPDDQPGHPYPSANLLAMALLAQQPSDEWVSVAKMSHWLHTHHPYWANQQPTSSEETTDPTGVRVFLLGLAYHLRLVQVGQDVAGKHLVRLSELGRWLLCGENAPRYPSYPQTMLVQPNLEILLYRQGLTPELLKQVGRFAAWKNLGAVCSLQLEPETVYLALEEGETLASLLQTLERHGMKATPAPVVEMLRTWAQKRERLSVYPSAIILEFLSQEDLQEALSRGVPLTQVADKLALVIKEEDIDYKQFRLAGSRDYTLPPEQCVSVSPDGTVLEVDLTCSDLLLESELQRFAKPLEEESPEGNKQYFQLTPATLNNAEKQGLTVEDLETWFLNRCGHPLPDSIHLIMTGKTFPPVGHQRLEVIRVEDPKIADGLLQWPGTRDLIEERLGPTSLVIAEEQVSVFKDRLATLGIQMEEQE